ncbi:MAG: hypothetical protein PUB39_02955 [Eubacteriales bacterium]|nr:hypothetical protein [Eubacteriales bacterium]
MYFCKEHDANCALADKAIKELVEENPNYHAVEFRKIPEEVSGELSSRYPHQNVPCFYLGKNDTYEYKDGDDYDEIKRQIKRVMDLFLNSSIL